MESLSLLQLFNCQTVGRAIDYVLEVPMYVGIAVAIGGIALTLFSGISIVYTAAFALLTGVCILGAYHARKSALLKQLQEKIDQLEQLRQDLEKNNEALKNNVEAFSKENQELHKEIGTLTASVEQMTEMVRQAKHLLEDFQKERARLAEQSSAIGARTARLEKIAARAISKMEEQLLQSEEMLENTKALLKEEVGKSVEALSLQIQQATHESRLQLCTEIAKAEGELTAVREAFAKERKQLTRVREELETTEGRLREVREEIAEETRRLSSVAERVEGAVDMHISREKPPIKEHRMEAGICP